MKFRLFFLLIALWVMSPTVFSQRVYGTLDELTGKITLTNEIAYAKQKLQESLRDPGAVLSNIEILKDADNTVFLLAADVTNSKDGISAIGVELHRTGTAIHGSTAAAGPGIKHTCKGNPCSSCKLKLRPIIHCDCQVQGSCDHTTEIILTL